MVDQELLEEARLVSDVFVLLDRMPKRSVVAEIGVATGGLSEQILKRTAPKKLYLVDPWDDDSVQDYSEQSYNRILARMKKAIDDDVVVLKRGYSQNVLPTFPANYFDWVYVDAAHDYDSVRTDLMNCHEIVKPGGLIAGHDYIRWVSPTERYGVVEAVNEFVGPGRFVMLTNQLDKHDSFAIRIDK